MAYAPRESSFMPTIKCSMCAADIEISMMGDHVCAEAPPVPALPSLPPAGEPTPPPDSNGSFDRMPYSKPSNNSGLLKPGRQMPPKVDTSAANRPFFRPAEQYTPVSASPSRTGSPFGQPQRSATAPLSLSQRPPSPAFQTGLDSPFPPFPGTKQSRPQTPQPREAPQKQLQGGYGGFGLQKPEGDSMYAPVSPRTATSGGLLQRMNTIAPGPFDPRSRPGTREQSEVRGHERTKTAGSIRDSPDSTSAPASRGHSQAASISSVHSHASKGSVDRGVMAPKVPRKNGYGGFGPPPAAENGFERPPLMSPDSRSQTFPKTSQSQGPNTRRPSEPASTPGFGPRLRRPSNASIRGDENGMPNGTSPPRGRRPSMGPDTSRAPPPRGVSLIRSSRANSKMGDAPPVPSNLNLAAEFGIGNPYHTPSESTSSNGSGYSEGSKASSQSSPPATSPAKSRRNGSNTSNIDLLMSEIQSSMTDLQPREIPATAPPLQVKTNMASSPEMHAPKPPVSYSGIQEPKPLGSLYGVQEPKPLGSSYGVQDPSVQAPKSMGPPISMYGVIEPGPQSYGRQDRSMLSSESPTDPAVQGGSASPVSRSRSPGPIDPAVQGGRRSPVPRGLSPAPLERSKTPGTTRRPGTSKGTCKHCKLPIKSGQKSVSSADGRLTGRYHKTCFCCTTCLEPFSTATFYVINDAPYCERHYHKLNGSVCSTCDKGIEGQYLESERREKFHPGCLTCADCRRTLRNDYFEMDGRVYCERDAFRRTQQERQQQQRGRPGYGGGRGGGLGAGLNVPGGGTSRMQRRTTRLMMM